VASDGTILTAPPGGASSTFSTVTTGSFIDGIAFDPTGTYLFVSNRTLNTVTIINRSGGLVQNSGVISGVPDGISFHATAPKFVVTNNNDGSMTRLDFPGDNYTMPPTLSLFASGGFRGDLTQVGPDGCIYLTQDGTRYDDGTSSSNSSIVHICPGFAPPPGVGGTPLNPGTTTCNGVYNGTGTDVIVPSGAVCTLAAGTIVTHDVKVEPGGTLIDLGAAIGHDINANSPKGMQIAGGTVGHDLKINGLNGSPPTGHNYVCSTTVSHDLVVTNGTAAAGSIDIGDPPDCSAGNQVGHDLNVQGNANHVDVSENGTAGTPIGHDLIVRNNTPGGATVTHNYAGNNATCSGNSPQAGAGNHAAGTNTCPL
jgi:hypothetical protein